MSSPSTSNKQIPALHKYAWRQGYIESGDFVLDVGCGKYVSYIAEWMHEQVDVDGEGGILYHGYDPHWHPDEYIKEWLHRGRYDVYLCANVLNVIPWQEQDEFDGLLYMLSHACSGHKTTLFSVYEGDKSGVGKYTSRGYQRNLKAKKYMPQLSQYFTHVKRSGNILICSSN